MAIRIHMSPINGNYPKKVVDYEFIKLNGSDAQGCSRQHPHLTVVFYGSDVPWGTAVHASVQALTTKIHMEVRLVENTCYLVDKHQ